MTAATDPRTCACGRPVSRRSTTGLCRSCGCKRAFADPAVGRKRAASLRATLANMSDARREQLRELVKHARACIAADARGMNNPTVRAAAFAAARARLDWCPPHLRAEYTALKRSQRCSAAEARAMIEAQYRAELKRLPPLERQLQLLRDGRPLVAAFRSSRPDPTMTLGGVASGMI